jgi:Fe-S cluster assembly protein SufD
MNQTNQANQTSQANQTQKSVFQIAESSKHTLEKPGIYLFEITKPGVELEIGGVFDVGDRDRAEVAVIIHHKAPHTRAETTLKGVARDHASLTFVGRIIIDEDCGDSHSFLTERILLLSDTAHAKAVPDLEIKTDDVSCSHAASISDIPEDHIFYLMTRGITRQQAEEMIVEGFLE